MTMGGDFFAPRFPNRQRFRGGPPRGLPNVPHIKPQRYRPPINLGAVAQVGGQQRQQRRQLPQPQTIMFQPRPRPQRQFDPTKIPGFGPLPSSKPPKLPKLKGQEKRAMDFIKNPWSFKPTGLKND